MKYETGWCYSYIPNIWKDKTCSKPPIRRVSCIFSLKPINCVWFNGWASPSEKYDRQIVTGNCDLFPMDYEIPTVWYGKSIISWKKHHLYGKNIIYMKKTSSVYMEKTSSIWKKHHIHGNKSPPLKCSKPPTSHDLRTNPEPIISNRHGRRQARQVGGQLPKIVYSCSFFQAWTSW